MFLKAINPRLEEFVEKEEQILGGAIYRKDVNQI